MRVLYVENDATSANAVELMLGGLVREYDTTPLGQIGFELAEHKNYHVILIDLMLPDIDGYEVIRRLRSAGVNTPYLILSGLVDRESEFSALAFGVGGYLVKPFTRIELLRRIEPIIARSKLADLAGLDDDPPDPNTPQGVGAERRKHQRFKTIKTAKIDYGPGIDCIIWNLSHSGAAIRLSNDRVNLPPSFFLEIDYGTTYLCGICWRDGDEIGVKFIEKPE